MLFPISPVSDVVVLPSREPVPGHGFLPVNAFLLRGETPILVDCGSGHERGAFMEALETVIDPRSIRAVLLTHEDGDHSGALIDVLDRAPEARVYTTLAGLGKLLSAVSFSPERAHLVVPGSEIAVGSRRFHAVRPPMYDSPATLAYADLDRRYLFTSDALGAFLPATPDALTDLDMAAVCEGMSRFCRINSPWLATVDRSAYARELERFRALATGWVFGAHLLPARAEDLAPLFDRAAQLPDEGELALPDQKAFLALLGLAA